MLPYYFTYLLFSLQFITEQWKDLLQTIRLFIIRQEFMENECEALPGVAYPGVQDNRSTINTKTGYDDDDKMGDAIGFRQQLSTTSFESFELEITVNYPVHT